MSHFEKSLGFCQGMPKWIPVCAGMTFTYWNDVLVGIK